MKKKLLVIKLNKKYYLKVDNKLLKCQIGKGGFKNTQKKTEGDKATPIGKWYLESLYYRSDRIIRPRLKKKNALKINKITKYCGWCDDISSNYYNRYMKINNFNSVNLNYENLWRQDKVYDLIIVTSYNTKPTIRNKGSAIFIHCSFCDDRSTAGCIALKKKDLVFLLKNLNDKTFIKIKN